MADHTFVNTLINEFLRLDLPGSKLVDAILDALHVADNVELRLALNKHDKRVRDGAMQIVERHVDELLSSDTTTFRKARASLEDWFYPVDMGWEEG